MNENRSVNLCQIHIIFCVSWGMFLSVNVNAMRSVQKGSQIGGKALVLSTGVNAASRQCMCNAPRVNFCSSSYDPSRGNEATRHLRDSLMQLHAKVPGGSHVYEHLQAAIACCDTRDKMVHRYEELRVSERTPIDSAECQRIEEWLQEEDKNLLMVDEEQSLVTAEAEENVAVAWVNESVVVTATEGSELVDKVGTLCPCCKQNNIQAQLVEQDLVLDKNSARCLCCNQKMTLPEPCVHHYYGGGSDSSNCVIVVLAAMYAFAPLLIQAAL